MNKWRFYTKIYPTSVNVSVASDTGSCQLTSYHGNSNVWCVREFEVHIKRQGQGREMYEHICEYLRNKGATRIEITSEDTSEALKFWSNVTGQRFSLRHLSHTVDLFPAAANKATKTFK